MRRRRSSAVIPKHGASSTFLFDAALELLGTDDLEFACRRTLMRDEDGRAMLDKLAGQPQRLGAHIADVADALGLTMATIRDAMLAHT